MGNTVISWIAQAAQKRAQAGQGVPAIHGVERRMTPGGNSKFAPPDVFANRGPSGRADWRNTFEGSFSNPSSRQQFQPGTPSAMELGAGQGGSPPRVGVSSPAALSQGRAGRTFADSPTARRADAMRSQPTTGPNAAIGPEAATSFWEEFTAFMDSDEGRVGTADAFGELGEELQAMGTKYGPIAIRPGSPAGGPIPNPGMAGLQALAAAFRGM